eukprot:10058778-Lingulodinium_polyedra.AAC.1
MSHSSFAICFKQLRRGKFLARPESYASAMSHNSFAICFKRLRGKFLARPSADLSRDCGQD